MIIINQEALEKLQAEPLMSKNTSKLNKMKNLNNYADLNITPMQNCFIKIEK